MVLPAKIGKTSARGVAVLPPWIITLVPAFIAFAVIPFGTGGRRGRMYPIGCNAINDRTIGESAQGLAAHVTDHARGKPLACAIAYDTRHRSRHFAELSAETVSEGGEIGVLDEGADVLCTSCGISPLTVMLGISMGEETGPQKDRMLPIFLAPRVHTLV